VAEMLVAYYSGLGKFIPDLCSIVGNARILNMDDKEVSFKIKTFLRAVALGMVPSRPWDTYLNTYGGYLVVKKNGDVVCYHLYNDDKFKDSDNGELKLKLNLQIRFN
jgi:hypothetical protein